MAVSFDLPAWRDAQFMLLNSLVRLQKTEAKLSRLIFSGDMYSVRASLLADWLHLGLKLGGCFGHSPRNELLVRF